MHLSIESAIMLSMAFTLESLDELIFLEEFIVIAINMFINDLSEVLPFSLGHFIFELVFITCAELCAMLEYVYV